MAKRITGAKVACLDFSLNKAKMKLGVQVLVDDPNQLEAIRQRSAFTPRLLAPKIKN